MSDVQNVSSRRLSDEECRILIAAEEERLYMNSHGRYEIDQEVRPDRKTRESLAKRGLIGATYRTTTYRPSNPYGDYRITARGKTELRREISKRVAEKR